MLNKILFVVCFLAVGTAYFFYKETIYHKNRYAVSHANNQLLFQKIDEVYNDKLETDKRIKELQEEAKKDKAFNWNTDISSSPVIKRLQAN